MLLLHDLDKIDELRLSQVIPPQSLFASRQITQHCVGCFGCWIKTPGLCSINQDGQNALLCRMAVCRRYVLLSRCVYGGLSPELKMAYDRSIGYLLPNFYVNATVNETHHPCRYSNAPVMTMFFYGDTTAGEQQTATQIMQANSINWGMPLSGVYFSEDVPECVRKIEEVLQGENCDAVR